MRPFPPSVAGGCFEGPATESYLLGGSWHLTDTKQRHRRDGSRCRGGAL